MSRRRRNVRDGTVAVPDLEGAVAILDAGAYGYTMASRYNGRAIPAEVFVRGGAVVAQVERRGAEEWVLERSRIAERG